MSSDAAYCLIQFKLMVWFLSSSALFNFSFWRDGEKNDPPVYAGRKLSIREIGGQGLSKVERGQGPQAI